VEIVKSQEQISSFVKIISNTFYRGKTVHNVFFDGLPYPVFKNANLLSRKVETADHGLKIHQLWSF